MAEDKIVGETTPNSDESVRSQAEAFERSAEALLQAGEVDHFLGETEHDEEGDNRYARTDDEKGDDNTIETETAEEREARIERLEKGETKPQEEEGEQDKSQDKTEEEKPEQKQEKEGEEETKEGAQEGEEENQETEPPIEKLTELAEAFAESQGTSAEKELEQLQGLKVTVNTSEGDSEVEIGELLKSYERQADYTAKTTALSNERTEFSEMRQQYQEEAQKAAQTMFGTLQHVYEGLQAKLTSDEMNQLRTSTEEGAFQEYQLRKEAIEADIQNVQGQYQQLNQTYDGFVQQQREEFAKEQVRILNNDLDGGWDEGKLQDVVKEFTSMGFQQHEMPHLMDARLIKAGLEVKSLRAENEQLKARAKKGEQDLKKVAKNVPTLNKAGKVQKRGDKPKQSKYAAAAARVAKRTAENYGMSNTNDVVNMFEAGLEEGVID